MAYPLHTHSRPIRQGGSIFPIIAKVTRSLGIPAATRADHVLIARELPGDSDEFAAVLVERRLDGKEIAGLTVQNPLFHDLKSSSHLAEGDVVAIQENGYVRTLFRVASQHNFIFATERCNSFCLMCSQPPREVDDTGRVEEHLRTIELADPDCTALGITGGEPTLLEDGFLRIVEACKAKLPKAALHVLSNGRRFADARYARDLAAIRHPDLMVAVPLYSAVESRHDYVVQAAGAFSETIRGLFQLGRYGIRLEIRCVVHRLTYGGLLELAEFIHRNLTFVDHVALMGLELMGFAWPNREDLWIDPWDYRSELEAATLFLARRRIPVSIYNHPLCLLPPSLRPFSRQSISDWKNEYLPVCADCSAKEACGGFFTSSVKRRHSIHVRPLS